MSFSVTISWWIIPLMITAALFAWFASSEKSSGGFDIVPLFRLVAAIIGSLVAWLVWALLR